MTADATAELLAAMAAFDLNPGTIEWTGKIVRFRGPKDKGRKKDGWYVAYPDPPMNAVFGHWADVPKQYWHQTNGGAHVEYDEAARKEWAERERQREAARAALQDKVATKAAELWERARPATPDHPYLKKKGVTDPEGLRVIGQRLLIPMRGLGRGSPIRSLQAIQPDGEKRFMTDGQTAGTRTTIGANGPKDTIYIVEGWATGWSVHKATGSPVVVAFMANNLRAIALAMREKYPKARLIIAADNDQFTETWVDGRKEKNPGLIYARMAASAVDALVVHPTFRDLEGKPTDFNDLHQREGLDAVVICLTPQPPTQTHPPTEIAAPTRSGEVGKSEAPPKDPPSGPPEAPEPVASWVETAPFRLLGYDHDTYFYMSKEKGQITELTPSAHTKANLMALAPLPWWEGTFGLGKRKGVDWDAAQDALMRVSHRASVFRYERLRGRGCWPVGDGIALHLGDRLLAPGAGRFVNPDSYVDPQRRIYERLHRLEGPSEKRALPLSECRRVLDLFTGALWHEEASGILLAGWTVLAPLCAALPWRPHIWIHGDSGAGKTTLIQKVVVPLMGGDTEDHGGMCHYLEGGTTEAGIRHKMRSDGLPVVYDEAEKQDQKSDDRIQAVLALMRSASSSGAQVAKGSATGKGVSYAVRSMFCLVSIGTSLRQEADKSRVALLQLQGSGSVTPETRRAHWASYRPKLTGVNEQLGRELVARTLGWIRDGRLFQTVEVFRAAASVVLGDSRVGDQYGTLYAGAWTLMADDAPNEQEARDIIGGGDLSDYIVEQMPAGKKALLVLLQKRERVETKNGPKVVTVGQLIDACLQRPGSGVEYGDAEAVLKQMGLRVEIDNGAPYLFIATLSQWVTEALRDTPYGDNLHGALRTLSGVQVGKKIRFHAGLVSHTTMVPIAAFDG